MCYARVEKELPKPLTAPEVLANAAQHGLCLVRSSNVTGFKSVFKHRNGYKAKVGAQYLGSFPTAEEAALCYTRHIGSERAAAEATNWNEWASSASGHGWRGRLLPSELTGAPCIGLVASLLVALLVAKAAVHIAVTDKVLFATEPYLT